MTKLDHINLPDEVTNHVAAQINAARFHTVDEALAAVSVLSRPAFGYDSNVHDSGRIP